MTELNNVNDLHGLLVYYDNFSELKGRIPSKSWFDKDTGTYNILYKDGFLFNAPKSLVDILCDGAVNGKNPIITSTKAVSILDELTV